MSVFFRNLFSLILIIGIFSIFIANCATQRGQHRVVERTELPIFEADMEVEELILTVVFHINEEGEVKDVRLETSSGDREWDKMAVDSLKQWRFAEPPTNSDEMVVRRDVRMEILSSEVMNLGKLIAHDEAEANVLYNRLRAGIRFEQLIEQASEGSSLGKAGYILEGVDTIEYPARISKILLELDVGSYSRPVLVDGDYVIFKRYGDQLP